MRGLIRFFRKNRIKPLVSVWIQRTICHDSKVYEFCIPENLAEIVLNETFEEKMDEYLAPSQGSKRWSCNGTEIAVYEGMITFSKDAGDSRLVFTFRKAPVWSNSTYFTPGRWMVSCSTSEWEEGDILTLDTITSPNMDRLAIHYSRPTGPKESHGPLESTDCFWFGQLFPATSKDTPKVPSLGLTLRHRLILIMSLTPIWQLFGYGR